MLLHKSDRKLPDFLLTAIFATENPVEKIVRCFIAQTGSAISRYVHSVRILQRKIIKLQFKWLIRSNIYFLLRV